MATLKAWRGHGLDLHRNNLREWGLMESRAFYLSHLLYVRGGENAKAQMWHLVFILNFAWALLIPMQVNQFICNKIAIVLGTIFINFFQYLRINVETGTKNNSLSVLFFVLIPVLSSTLDRSIMLLS